MYTNLLRFDFFEELAMILCHEWWTSNYHFEQNGTGRPEVNRAVVFLHIEDLGGPEK